MRIYDENGYLDMARIIGMGYPFTIVMNGRGTGKTFGAIQHVIKEGTPFLYMRRMQSQVDLIKSPEFDPFRPVSDANGWNLVQAPVSKKNSGVYFGEEENGLVRASGSPLGITAALSTFSSMRGMSAEYIKVILYDEFIPEWNERPLKEEYYTLKNAIETIGRNRELKGDKPVQLVAMANSNDIANPILVGMNLVNKIGKMRERGDDVYQDSGRGVLVIYPSHSPISEAKTETSLYRLDGADHFADMALGNRFQRLSNSEISTRPLKEYRPICSVGEITVYKHKASGGFYVSTHHTGSPKSYGTSDIELSRFFHNHYYLRGAFLTNRIIFESEICEILLDKYLKP